MNRFAGILLHVNPYQWQGASSPILATEGNRSAQRIGPIELADLVALRQIGIEVILAIKTTLSLDLALEADGRTNRTPDGRLVDHRQGSWPTGTNRADVVIRIETCLAPTTAEHLATRCHLGMDFETDHRLPVHDGLPTGRSR